MTEIPDRLAAALADRYALERVLGQGGMATVYLARDLKHHRHVAVKVLRPELAAAIGPERFLREIETTASLHHPHILPLYDSGQAIVPPLHVVERGTGGEEGVVERGPGGEVFLYYVMPYVEGESLRDRLDRDKQLPLDDALGIAREVADALSFAHSRGIVHRDIKPDNILLANGHAMVADFGIARAVSAAGADRLTATGIAVGTPVYMSPEQAAGESEIDGRSDLYSLACVLYEMLAGQPPFTGPTAESVVRQHLTADARPIGQLRPAVPPAIAEVLARALAKNPADRFSPAAHFATALMTSAGPVTQPVRARPARTVLGVAAVLIALAALAVSVRRSGEGPVVAIGRTIQVTGEAGLEVDPSLSPDGTAIAYAAGPTNAMQIYVRQVSGGRPVALTNDTTDHFRWPRWSPDGTHIAYQSFDGIDVVPALGGAPRRLIRIDTASGVFVVNDGVMTGFDWSPDGSRIAWVEGFASSGIKVVTLSDGDTVTLAAPDGAFAPAWSRDGRRIAVAAGNPPFIFGTGYFANAGPSSIWIVPVDGAPARQVASDSTLNVSPQWSRDGRDLLWVSDRDGSRDIYQQRIRSNGTSVGVPRRVTTGANAQGLSMSQVGRLAYSQLVVRSSIWSIPVPTRGPVSIRGATRLTTRNEIIEDVDVSADGRWLVFDSDRSGNPDLYVMPAAGGEARQLTTDPAGDFSGDWSPDGRRIVFHTLRNGSRDIYTLEADGTGLRQWTSSAAEELDADWAPDGESVVYEVFGGEDTRHGFETRRLVDGSEPAFLAIDRADFAHWSPDGGAILYHAVDGIGVRRLDTGAETLVSSNAADGADAHYGAWSPDGTKIYYLARSPAGWTIRAVGAAGGASTVLVHFDDPTRQHTRYGFATDGRFFYLTIGVPESDLVVAELEQR